MKLTIPWKFEKKIFFNELKEETVLAENKASIIKTAWYLHMRRNLGTAEKDQNIYEKAMTVAFPIIELFVLVFIGI